MFRERTEWIIPPRQGTGWFSNQGRWNKRLDFKEMPPSTKEIRVNDIVDGVNEGPLLETVPLW